jgi:N-methylhydantoinase A
MLRVGPQSAGSEPGPICYGRGGSEPTVTDANLVLGRLSPGSLFTVGRPVTAARVREVFAAKLAGPLGISVDEAAAAVLRLGNTHMAGAIRMVSLARGLDPRDFVLFAFGGAGPLHAVALARELGLPEVLVPARPGLTNALGCLVADLRQDFVNTLNVPLGKVDMDEVAAVLAAQREQGIAINAEEQGEIVETAVLHAADMQFLGQTHILRVSLPVAAMSRDALQALFEAAYFARFQVRLPEVTAVLVNLATSVIGRRRAFPIASLIAAAAHAERVEEAVIGERSVFAGGRWQSAQVLARMRLPRGARFSGPAIVEQQDATTIIEPGAAVSVDAIGNLRIAVGSAP